MTACRLLSHDMAFTTKPFIGLAIIAMVLFTAKPCVSQDETVVTVTGLLVDNFCWVDRNGIALDTRENLKMFPNKHTVHCLVEVGICRNSGFVVVHKPSGSDQYQVLYELDEPGNTRAIELMYEVPPSERWTPTGYELTVTGIPDKSNNRLLITDPDSMRGRIPGSEPLLETPAPSESPIPSAAVPSTSVPTSPIATEAPPRAPPSSTRASTPGVEDAPPHAPGPVLTEASPISVPLGTQQAPDGTSDTIEGPTTVPAAAPPKSLDAPQHITFPAANDTASNFTAEAISEASDTQTFAAGELADKNDASLVTVTGLLVDFYCWKRLDGTALDTGANLKLHPERHTVHCMIDVDVCLDGGFAIVHKPEGSEEYRVMHWLDEPGNKQAAKLMSKMSYFAKHNPAGYEITVTGTPIPGKRILATMPETMIGGRPGSTLSSDSVTLTRGLALVLAIAASSIALLF